MLSVVVMLFVVSLSRRQTQSDLLSLTACKDGYNASVATVRYARRVALFWMELRAKRARVGTGLRIYRTARVSLSNVARKEHSVREGSSSTWTREVVGVRDGPVFLYAVMPDCSSARG